MVSLANRQFEAPSWDTVYSMLIDLSKQVRRSGFSPDVIVGVSRGGWPPARVISDLLENQNLANMKVVFYKDIGVRNKTPVITQPVTTDVSGRRVLVVDDVSDSGNSLKVVANHLRKKGAKEVKVCTLYFKPHSIFKPDYYAKTTTKWVIFPWERLEAVKLIARREKERRGRDDSVIRRLSGSGLSGRLIRELLRLGVDRSSS